jgi:hypothetical protein
MLPAQERKSQKNAVEITLGPENLHKKIFYHSVAKGFQKSYFQLKLYHHHCVFKTAKKTAAKLTTL